MPFIAREVELKRANAGRRFCEEKGCRRWVPCLDPAVSFFRRQTAALLSA